MKPPKFAYIRPASLDDACRILARAHDAGEEVKCLAGGQTLLPVLNLRLAEPRGLVDLSAIPDLSFIRREREALVVGAMTRHAEIEHSPVVAECLPLLGRAAQAIAHMTVRNRGTMGGSLAHADPAAEWPLCTVALDARITLLSVRSKRQVAARDFFRGPLVTDIAPDEILTEIAFPLPRRPQSFGFQEFARRAGAFAIALVACTIEWDGDRIAAASIALGGVHDRPLFAADASAMLMGRAPDDELFRAAAKAAAAATSPVSDVHGSAAYRRHLAEVLTFRALRQAAARDTDHATSAPRPPRRVAKPVTESAAETQRIRFTLNGREVEAEVPVRRLLADFLRQDLGLVGTRIGCEHGVCGACTVLIDRESVRSCLTLAVQADGAEVTTLEGLGPDGAMHPLQQAFWDHHAMQCGYCTSGILMTAWDLLDKNPDADEAAVRHALSGNLCRCTGYANMVRAVTAVAEGAKHEPA